MNLDIRRAAYTRDYNTWVFEQKVEVLDEAIVAHQTVFGLEHEFVNELPVKRNIFDGGVYDRAGGICSTALHEGKLDLRNVPADKAPASAEHLAGTWLFGGFYFRHIGHMVTESSGRLWGATEPHDFAGVIFICWNGKKPETDLRTEKEWNEDHSRAASQNPRMVELLSMCGVVKRIKFLSASVTVERLVVPSQLSGLIPYRSLMEGHPSHVAFISERMSRFNQPQSPKRIFVSRSRYPNINAMFFMEDVLDQCFFDAGYAVIYPETLSLEQQISFYRGADQIVLAAGSASHILALASKGGQEIVVLMRYTNQNDQFTQQLLAAGAGKALFIDCLNGMFIPRLGVDRVRLNLHQAALVYTVDFVGLWRILQTNNFVNSPLITPWSESFMQRVREKLQDLESKYGASFTLASRSR